MAADGQIVLGLDINQTQAQIQSELNGVLRSTKVQKIILETAIEKTETEKQINATVSKLNKKTIEMGVRVNSRDVNQVLTTQQKIASTQAKLNAQMKEYRDTAKSVGLTLKQDSWNPFSKAVSSGNFEKANEILKATKKQIDSFNLEIKQMNSDTSVGRSVSNLISQFKQLKDVSRETQSRIGLLKANLSQFEKEDQTPNQKLAAYNRLKKTIENLRSEFVELSNAEKSQNSDLSIKNKIADATSALAVFETKFKDIGDSAEAKAITTSISELKTEIDKANKIDSGSRLHKQWESVASSIEKVNRAVAEYNASQKSVKSDSKIAEQIKDAESKVKNLKTTYSNLFEDGAKPSALRTEIEKLDNQLVELNKKSLSGNALAREWEKVNTTIKEVNRAVAEYKTNNTILKGKYDIVNNIGTSAADYYDAASRSGLSGTSIDNLKLELSALKINADELATKLANLDPSDAGDIKRLNEEIEVLRKKFDAIKKDSGSFKNAFSTQQLITNIEKAKQKVTEYADKYSAIKSRPELVKELAKLQEEASKLTTQSDLDEFNLKFEQFNTKVKQAGANTTSFADKLKTAFKNFAAFFSASRIFYQVIEKFKEMVEYVKNIDAAMINLKKVTDETDASYNRFLINAKANAKELGTTVSDLVNATANFSKLGFDMDDAEKLGQFATIYANVGDLNSIDDATNSLISSMKGFGLTTEDAASILDKFNEVGNNFAISSGDIGEALQRSASSMAAANNTIDETIALITAANTVVQDATSVGTAFKTKFLRLSLHTEMCA